MTTHSSTLAWKIPWMEEPGRLQSMGSLRVRHDWATSLSLHFNALEKEMATHSSVLAWRIPGTGESGGLPSKGSQRVGHDWIDLAAAAWEILKMIYWEKIFKKPLLCYIQLFPFGCLIRQSSKDLNLLAMIVHATLLFLWMWNATKTGHEMANFMQLTF